MNDQQTNTEAAEQPTDVEPVAEPTNGSGGELPRLTQEEIKILQQFQAGRDRAAIKIGVAYTEFQRAVDMETKRIEQSLLEEKRVGAMILENHGIDMSADRFTINYDTGEIVKL